LYVESAPGSIAKLITFDTEQALVRSNLAGLTWDEIKNPTRAQLSSKIRDVRPDVIHLAGVDTHQGSVGSPKALHVPRRAPGSRSAAARSRALGVGWSGADRPW
jgi:hypothetical protein